MGRASTEQRAYVLPAIVVLHDLMRSCFGDILYTCSSRGIGRGYMERSSVCAVSARVWGLGGAGGRAKIKEREHV